MVSVERVVEFSSLAPEAALLTDEDKKHVSWPNQGQINIDSLTVRYRSNLPPSLSGVSLHIEQGQRVGVVGRTGSGKSRIQFFNLYLSYIGVLNTYYNISLLICLIASFANQASQLLFRRCSDCWKPRAEKSLSIT